MEGGDLRARNAERDPATGARLFGWYQRGRRVALDVACALLYLHTSSYTHFDIKSRNVGGLGCLGGLGALCTWAALRASLCRPRRRRLTAAGAAVARPDGKGCGCGLHSGDAGDAPQRGGAHGHLRL